MLRDSVPTIEEKSLSETGAERDRRRALGIYYTPPEAAKILARWAIRSPEETVLEPSFGGCAMLSAAVSVFAAMGNRSPSKQLYGYDVDPTAFKHLKQMGIDNTEKNFKKQDFLRSKSKGTLVDAVLANPPFVSYHRLNEKQRQLTVKLRQKYLPQLPKLASLWVYFLLHSLSFLRPGGRMAFLLPTAVGNADYARPLLTFLQQRFSGVELVHVNERLFIQAGADERISLLLLSDYAPSGLASAPPVRTRNIASIEEAGLPETPAHEGESGSMGLDVRDLALDALAQLEHALVSLGSVASVKIGEVVGDIGFFVKPISEWRKQKIAPAYLVPLLTRSAQIRGIYIPTTEEQEQHEDPSTVPYLLLPPERRLPKAIETYLAQYPKEDIANNKTFEKRSIWYRCSYASDAHAFIGSISHDYPRIIGNPSGISCSNAFYKIVLQQPVELAEWLPILSITTPLRLSAEIHGRVRGSGGIKLEPSDVKHLLIPMQLPRLSKEDFVLLRRKIGKLLRDGELDAAGQLADSQVFLLPGLIDAQTMSKLRLMRLGLTGRRLP